MRRAGDTLFSTRKGAKPMNNMTWLDLYNYLHEQANNIQNVGQFPWQNPAEVFDYETLKAYPIVLSTITFPDNTTQHRLTTEII